MGKQNILNNTTQIFGCATGECSFKYLGIPMHHIRINNSDWKIIEDKFEKKTK
jgi:hypothetical protein